jgi:deoxyinosine 3'endonuclease (endonuclease V)
MALRTSTKFRRVYVSPGNGIGVADAARMAMRVSFGHRLPEPLFQADKLSRAQARSIQASKQVS